tara:strand:+ start:294 stop:608 length:315 start_codon:yes stop_codon:yes gene_type:complete
VGLACHPTPTRVVLCGADARNLTSLAKFLNLMSGPLVAAFGKHKVVTFSSTTTNLSGHSSARLVPMDAGEARRLERKTRRDRERRRKGAEHGDRGFVVDDVAVR